MMSFRRRDIAEYVSHAPLRLLTLIAAVVFTASILRNVATPARLLNSDGAFYAHAGWFVTQGAVPYVDFWDVKPPLVFEWTALLGALSGGNMTLLAALHVLSTSLAGLASVVFVGLLVRDYTNDGKLGLLAGLVILSYPAFHYYAAHGFRPKYFTMCFGLASLYALRTRRPAVAGGVAAAAAGFWQFGLIFPITVLAMERVNRDASPYRILGGMAAVTTVVLLPFVVWWPARPMLDQVIKAPFVLSEPWNPIQRAYWGFVLLGYLVPLVALGTLGIVRDAVSQRRRALWFVLPSVWFGLQIFYFDLDGFGDLLLGIVFVGIGVAVLSDHLTIPRSKTVAGVIVACLVVSATVLGGVGVVGRHLSTNESGIVGSDYGDPGPGHTLVTDVMVSTLGITGDSDSAEATSKYAAPDKYELYWEKRQPCHYFIGDMGRNWIRETGGRYVDESCYDGGR